MPQRRNLGGARHEASDRVVLRAESAPGEEILAWTLNVSRGGLRVVVEDPVKVGEEYVVSVGEEPPCRARVVWLREEADGQIAGLQFEEGEHAGIAPSELPPPPNPA